VGGNTAVAKAGRTLFTQNADFLGGGASILSVEQVLTRMSGPSAQASPFPAGAWPSETFNQPRKFMYLNGEGIEILHQPAAHTDGDAIVFFRRSDVVVAGDIFDTTRFPVIDVAKGGGIQGEIAALQKLVDTAIPSVPKSVIDPLSSHRANINGTFNLLLAARDAKVEASSVPPVRGRPASFRSVTTRE